MPGAKRRGARSTMSMTSATEALGRAPLSIASMPSSPMNSGTPRRVPQQVHQLQLRLIGEPFGKVACNWIAHIEPPFLRERQHGRSRHVLRDRVDRLHGVRRHGRTARAIGEAPALCQEHPVVLQGYDCDTGNVLALHVSTHDAIDPRRRREVGTDRNRGAPAAENESYPPHAATRVPDVRSRREGVGHAVARCERRCDCS